MKRLLDFMLLGLIITLVACAKDEAGISDTGTSAQTITVTIPQSGVPTRATAADFGDGSKIDRCILQVYKNDQPYGEPQTVSVQNNQATFNLRLVTSQTYDFVFWADCSAGDHYDIDDLTAITVKDEYTGNNDEFDAFFYCLSNYEVNGSFSESVTLKRPFGQLVVKTADLAMIPDETLKPNKVKVAFTAVPTTFNAKTGVVAQDTKSVEYTATVVNESGDLSVDYIWASPDEANLADFKMTFYKNDTEITTNENFKNIPIRRNYRTNVSGNLLTKQGTINVTIDPIFEDENSVVMNGAMNVTTGEQFTTLQAAIDAASEGDEINIWGVIDEDIMLDKDLTIKGADETALAKIRTLNLASDINATVENVQFFGARNIAGDKTSVMVNFVESATFKNCVFAQENAEEGMRPLVTCFAFNGKLTIEGCTFEPAKVQAYINPLGENGELTITGSTFNQAISIEALPSANAQMGTYNIKDNTFADCVEMTAFSGAEDGSGLSAAEKTFINELLSNNEFGNDLQKVNVYSGSKTFYVNDLCATVYNQTTGVSYNTVGDALQAAQSGETILASGMTCADELTIPAGVTLDGAGSSVFTGKLHVAQGATLCNLTSEWNGAENRQAIEVQGVDVTLQNLVIAYKGSQSRPEAIVNFMGASGLTVKDCQFIDYWKGLYLNCAEGVTIEGCSFDNMNPFSTDNWSATLSFKGNTVTGNIPTFNAAHFLVPAGTDGMTGTNKYQESWPLALKESVYSVLADNTYEGQNTPYMRVTSADPAWDYNSIYFCVTNFLKGELANAQNAFTKADRYEPSDVEFLASYEGKTNVLKYTLDDRTSQAGRGAAYQGHFYNTQGRHFEVFNPAKLTKWEVSGEIWVDAQMIASQKPFRSELWTSSKYAISDEAAYPMLGITNVVEEDQIYQSTMDHAVVRTWGDNGWTVVDNVTVTAGWHTVNMVSDGNNGTYYYDAQPIGKLSADAASVYLISVMPEVFHYNYQHTDGRWFYEGYTCETYFCDINYKLNE